ncbi:hypothetical protein HNR41_001489 [Jeotgalicoccus coquinae]|uniref:Uncharacterized protein n=1 Tax=Jeotgalicoccus coquinae TaxID=709509 RepID=A0A6V7R2I7_9STAP|nr:hypothetical protein [Jeotgalicoccus coquinae]CAD2071541.1 hypothetical protein JEOCOQ751_00291 [Jeotgalicoccus coquinae]
MAKEMYRADHAGSLLRHERNSRSKIFQDVNLTPIYVLFLYF